MPVSLNDAQNRPISAFGSNSMWAQGAITNPAQFGATTAGSTKNMGYTTLAGRSAPHQAPMQPTPTLETPTSSGARPTADWGVEPPDNQVPPTSRNDEFSAGVSSSRGGTLPGGVMGGADDLDEAI